MSGLGLGLGLAHSTDQMDIDIVTASPLAVTTMPDGTIEITAEDGVMTITILPPSVFAGAYDILPEALASGPINLVPPQIDGTPAIGEILTATPGLWVFDTQSGAPALSWQWLQDGVVLPGQTALTFSVPADGATFGLNEIITQSGTGTAVASATGIAIESQTQTVTIPAGKVSEDLTNFPVRFDLATLSSDLWDDLRSDGGNLRATNAENTVSYPLDIVWIDAAARTGTAFIRQDLSAAGDTTFVLRTLDLTTPAAAPTDPAGRNAVWADYLAAVAFPDNSDRTGQHTVTRLGHVDAGYEATQVVANVDAHQGIAWTGTHWIVADTNFIKRYDATWTLLNENTDPLADAGIAGTNHMGDPCVHAGEIYIPVEQYPNDPYNNQHIAVFDVTTLAFVRSYDISAVGREASGFAYDPVADRLYCSDYVDGSSIPYFSLTGTYLGSVAMSQPIPDLQGIEIVGDQLYLSCDASDQLFVATLDGVVDTVPLYSSTFGSGFRFEGITYKDGDIYVLLDGATSPIYRLTPPNVLPESRDEQRFRAGCLQIVGIPSQAAWTSSVTVNPLSLPGNGAATSIVRTGAESNRTTAVVRTTSNPDTFNIWQSGLGYAGLPAPVTPVLGTAVRFAMAYDGVGQRKANLNGTSYLSATGTPDFPGGATMNWSIAGEDSNPTELVDGLISFAFLYSGYAPDARLEAEHATLHDTQNFYVIS